ncbi:MAG TPA: cell division protein SepF [Acidimicrobiales bacterium]|nr:cell division protein SepF [Acidimicrobiales bacterium]
MAPSFLKKTMVYLGLLDDEYDEYDEYDDRAPRGFSGVPNRVEPRPVEEPGPESRPPPPPVRRIRTLPADAPTISPRQDQTVITPRSASVRPLSADSAKVQVVAPSRFGDAKDIADCLKSNRPVIVNLQVAERDLQRRMIDFCSGVTYALSGEMEKVADEVFLLAPTNVKVSDEERQRLQARGFGRT